MRTVLVDAKANENRKWEYFERYFVPKEEKKVYDINGNKMYSPKHFFQMLTRKQYNIENFRDAFRLVTDGDPDLPPRFVQNNFNYYPWIMTEWIIHKKVILKGKKTAQSRINKMLSTRELEDIADIDFSNMDGYGVHHYTFAYYDSKGNVFRVFDSKHDEIRRIYLDKNGKVVICKNNLGSWVPNGSFNSSQFNIKIMNIDDVYDVPSLSYLGKLNNQKLYLVVKAFRSSDIEQLIKMGCCDIANNVICYSNNSIESELNYYLCTPIMKSKSICQKYGLTAKQLRVINNKCTRLYGNDLRKILGIEKLSSIDLDTFELYFDTISEFKNMRLNMSAPDKKIIFNRLAHMKTKYPQAVRVFVDTTREYINLWNNRPEIDWTALRKYEDIVRTHDMLVEIKLFEQAERDRLRALQEDERNAELEKKMAKLNEKRKGLNYEDDEFVICLPEKLREITIEGSVLRHCVGGYKEDHAVGRTTIMFLRRKVSPETPFYTIEVNNQNHIVQIHGYCNKWLGNNPEAIPTVMRWLKEHNIKCKNEILCSTARGYRMGNAPLVDLPTI